MVGGGDVAHRKAAALLSCGARVTVVAATICEKFKELVAAGAIELRKRPYRPEDLDGMFLVIGATDDRALNLQIKTNADQKGALCNIADCPEACHFILPAVVNRGDLVIAVSTSGKSPAFAKKLRKDLEAAFGPEYADFLKLMGAIRRRLLSGKHQPEEHRRLFEALIDKGLLHMIKDRDQIDIDSLLYETLGSGYRFDELMEMESEGR